MSCYHLVITADDLGIGRERDQGIAECYTAGAISRASLLVNGVSSHSAATLAKEIGLPLGLHLNLTEGRPISPAENVPSLIGHQGFMLGKLGLREELSAGKVSLHEIDREIQAQIDTFQELTGLLPTHVDGHQHVHVLPGIVDVFATALSANNILWTRLPLEDLGPADWIDETRMEFYAGVVKHSRIAKSVFEAKNLKFSRAFVGMSTMGKDLTTERLKTFIENTFVEMEKETKAKQHTNAPFRDDINSCELMVHPGYPCCDDDGGCGDGPDDFTNSEDRKHEMNILRSEELISFYKAKGVSISSYV